MRRTRFLASPVSMIEWSSLNHSRPMVDERSYYVYMVQFQNGYFVNPLLSLGLRP